MTTDEQEKVIRLWINPERVTARFLDSPEPHVEFTGCNNASVTLSIKTHVPYRIVFVL